MSEDQQVDDIIPSTIEDPDEETKDPKNNGDYTRRSTIQQILFTNNSNSMQSKLEESISSLVTRARRRTSVKHAVPLDHISLRFQVVEPQKI